MPCVIMNPQSDYWWRVTLTFDLLGRFCTFGAVDKTSSSFSAHGKIGNFIIFSDNKIVHNLKTDGQKLMCFGRNTGYRVA